MTRERTVRERRALKQEKKQAAREAKAAGIPPADAAEADFEQPLEEGSNYSPSE